MQSTLMLATKDDVLQFVFHVPLFVVGMWYVSYNLFSGYFCFLIYPDGRHRKQGREDGRQVKQGQKGCSGRMVSSRMELKWIFVLRDFSGNRLGAKVLSVRMQ